MARLTTPGQWLIVACVLFVIAFLDLYSTVDIAGVDHRAERFLALQLVDTGWLLLLTWAAWYVLDAIPFAGGRRWRNGTFRVILVVAAIILNFRFFTALVHLGLRIQPTTLVEDDNADEILLSNVLGVAVLMAGHMVLQRSHEQQQQVALERSLAATRLHALSLELQPHFLFNTMNGIAALIRENPVQAERMLLRLSDLLRLTFRENSNGTTSLRQELEQLDLYLDLQAMRFGSRLTVAHDIDPRALDGQVPRLLLQPLVENALSHGIAPRVGPGRIMLTAKREHEVLLLQVHDDGVGLPPPTDRHERTGIGTTRARLIAMFGDEHRFTLASGKDGGTEVTIRVPFVPASR